MKVWSLATGSGDYAVVFAKTEREAKQKVEKRTDIEEEEWCFCEEFKPGMYGDVLWFC